MLAHDQEGIQGWHWQGFGLIAADAVRDLRSIQETTAGIDIRQGSSQDLDQAIRLTDALQRHLAAAPTFLAYTHRAHAAWWEEWFASPANALWLALEGTQAVAFMKQEPPVEHDVSVFFRDDRSTSITGAFTAERLRGRGIATALLNQVLGRARCQHCERCAVSLATDVPIRDECACGSFLDEALSAGLLWAGPSRQQTGCLGQ
jgi:GNAT superfamily N-acetyltransferase